MKIKAVIVLLVLMLLVTFSAGCTPTPAVESEPEPVEVVEEPEVVAPEPEEPAEIVEPEEPEVVELAEPITLEIWALSQSPAEMEDLQTIAANFSDHYPNVTAEISFYTMADARQTFRLALDGGTGPDVMYISRGLVGADAYARAGHTVDLTDVAQERGWIDRFGQALLTHANLYAPDRRTFGVPIMSSTVGVYYNPEIFAEYGLTEPSTFEEFENILSTLKANGVTPFAVGALDGWPMSHYWEQLIHLTVPFEELTLCKVFDPAGNYEQAGFIEASEILVSWIENGYFQDDLLATNFADSNALFITGQTAMTITGTWAMNDFSTQPDFEARFFPVPPIYPDMPWHAGGQSPDRNWVIPKYAANIDMAINFLDYVLGEEVATMLWNNGNILTFKFNVMPEPVNVLQGDVYRSMVAAGSGYYPMQTGELQEIESNVMQQLIMGTITPEQAMADIQAVYLLAVEQNN